MNKQESHPAGNHKMCTVRDVTCPCGGGRGGGIPVLARMADGGLVGVPRSWPKGGGGVSSVLALDQGVPVPLAEDLVPSWGQHPLPEKSPTPKSDFAFYTYQ